MNEDSSPDVAAWQAFLRRWNAEIWAQPDLVADLPADRRATRWLGAPGASTAQIAAAEARLGAPLPPSYRAFLQASNGWQRAGNFIYRLYPVEEVDWHAARHQDLIDAWLDGRHLYGPPPPVPDAAYLVYDTRQDPAALRDEYLQTALEISEDYAGDGVVLLNPRIVTPAGEWEAWFFAAWLPGARRYRSFWELMQGARESFLQL